VVEGVHHEYSDPGFWVGSWRNVAIQLWGGETTVARLDKCGDCHRRVLRRYPNKLVTFAVIMPSVPPMLGEAERKRIRQLSDEQRHQTIAAVQVVEGTGFWASAVRAVLTGLSMFSVTKNKVFDAVPEAAFWLASAGVVEAKQQEVAAALMEARRSFDMVASKEG